jgi:hypothetical protein
MNRPTIERIHEVMKESGMVVFDKPFDVTLGAIRTKDNSSNKFNDWLFASFFTENGGIESVIVEGTTDAGLYFRKNLSNINGTAIIQHGKQYRGVYQYQNPKLNPKQRGHKGKEAFRQIKNMDYWRDADRDEYLEFEGETLTEIAYTNGHDMGTLGNNVDKWSAGCWGSTERNMDLLYLMALKQIENDLGDKFSFALLHENMF